MGGGLVCSPTLPLFSPFAGIPIFPPVPLQPSPYPHRLPTPPEFRQPLSHGYGTEREENRGAGGLTKKGPT